MKKITLLLATLSFFSCLKDDSKEKYEKISQLNWLIGNWEKSIDNGLLQETWSAINDSTLKGTTLFIKEKDTIHKETIELVQRGEKIMYIATVIGQNEDKPVTFTLTKSDSLDFIFENVKHDYPQKIHYKKERNESLSITISGNQSAKPASETYKLRKR